MSNAATIDGLAQPPIDEPDGDTATAKDGTAKSISSLTLTNWASSKRSADIVGVTQNEPVYADFTMPAYVTTCKLCHDTD